MTHHIDRRSFMGAGLAAVAAAALPSLATAAPTPAPAPAPAPAPRRFKLKYAPHFGSFRDHAGSDLVSQIDFMAAEGFRALEDNGMKGRSVADQERIAKAMQRHGMEMGVFVAHTIDWREPSLASGDAAIRDRFLQEIRDSVDVARRVDTKYMVIVPGIADRRRDPELQMVTVMETLRQATAILEPHGLTMLLEPLNTRVNHPGILLSRIPQLYLMSRAIDSPALKVLFDFYHEQINEGNLLPMLDAVWGEVPYVQVGDTPGRKEPGTGEINYRNIFKRLHEKGFTGIVGMEHGNSKPGREGERALIDAYVAADSF